MHGVGLREPAGNSPKTRRAPSADDQDEARREQRPFGAGSAKAARHALANRGPAHISKKTKAFVATLGSRLKLFYLPAYSPDRNPDELVWKHLKADTVGRMVTTSKADFKRKVVSSMRSLQKTPEKIRSFFQKPSLQYAA
jgi:transposase